MSAEGLPKVQELSLDKISELPETIIEAILCLLPIKETAKTSILSRKWRYKWTKVPILKFNLSIVPVRTTEMKQSYRMRSARENMERRCKLLSAIQQVLLLRQGPMHEFHLYMDECYKCYEIDQIILHLSRNHSVKKLRLELNYGFRLYKLPLCAFSLHQLTDLHLEFVDLDHEPIFSGFDNLRSLCLDHVEINTKALLHLLSKCPSLTSFTLLSCVGPIGHKDCTMIELFECLPMIEHLTISMDIVQKWLVLEEPRASLIRLKHVCFIDMCYIEDNGFVFLAILMNCSPNLEKFTLMTYDGCQYDVISSAVLAKYSNVWLEHLNELTFDLFMNYEDDILFINYEHEMELLKFILARSPKLKKVTIFHGFNVTNKEEAEMLTVILGAPGASSGEIIVKFRYLREHIDN